jgi:toxin ParE1/3/4
VKHYRVRLSEEAEQDLIDIYGYVAHHDSAEKAAYLLNQLETLCARLTELPKRGHVPPELSRIGVTAYKEVHFKPYRVIYEVVDQDVRIHGVLDGRRDMQTLLQRRLFREFQ